MTDKRNAVIARRQIAETVAAAFLPAEQSAEAAVTHGANCMSVMIRERGRAMLPPHAGAEAMNLIAVGTQLATEAHLQFAAAHKLLADLPAEFGLPTALGPDCAPNTLFTIGQLRAVT